MLPYCSIVVTHAHTPTPCTHYVHMHARQVHKHNKRHVHVLVFMQEYVYDNSQTNRGALHPDVYHPVSAAIKSSPIWHRAALGKQFTL